MIVVHGIPNCDGVRAARRWLTARSLDHRLRDLRADPPGEAEVSLWIEAIGWERLLNRRGRAWRTLSAAERDGVDEARAVTLMVAHPLLIKRPLLDDNGSFTLGLHEAG